MLVSERERVGYDDNYDYDYNYNRGRDNHSAYYDYESRYEEEKGHTSSSYRESLMSSLERPAARSRLERADDDRYDFYRTNIDSSENNYDRFLERRERKSATKKSVQKKKISFVAAYIAIAIIAVIAVTLSAVGIGKEEQTVAKKSFSIDTLSASAEVLDSSEALSAQAEMEVPEEKPLIGGENYIFVNGQFIEIEVPEEPKAAKEEEKGFDKFCSWLNGVFGG